MIEFAFRGRGTAGPPWPQSRRGRAGRPDPGGVREFTACRLPGSAGSIRRIGGGCQEESRTLGSRAGRPPVPSGFAGVISRALNGLSDHAATTRCREDGNGYPATSGLWAEIGCLSQGRQGYDVPLTPPTDLKRTHGAIRSFVRFPPMSHLSWRTGYPAPTLGVLGGWQFRSRANSPRFAVVLPERR